MTNELDGTGPTFDIQDKIVDKNFMIVYEPTTLLESKAGQAAVNDILTESNLRFRHQTGYVNPLHYQGYEIDQRIEKVDLERLLPLIENKYREHIETFQKNGWYQDNEDKEL